MKVLVIGQGGREHALVWKIAQSPKVKKIYCAPGNAGTSMYAENVSINADDLEGLASFSRKKGIDLTLVGPELPLASGIVDVFERYNLNIFGPGKEMAVLESSKVFTKLLSREEGIPTAEFEVFEDPDKARSFLGGRKFPIVIKADGLAAGKGVIIAKNKEEADQAIHSIMVERRFGSAGEKIIIEEYLRGEEASIIVLSDGEDIAVLASSQDHKRIYDGDKGPNTGGMGAYSPAPVVTEEVLQECISVIIRPAISGMKKRGTPYKGVLYAGIMVTESGPNLLEFNVRFGDPEIQAILPRMKSDLVELVEYCMYRNLNGYTIPWREEVCVCVVMASSGYPGRYQKGKRIYGIEKAQSLGDVVVFHAGTEKEDGDILTNGGRVLNVVALGDTIEKAIEKVYKGVKCITFEGAYYRKDIAQKALRKEKLNLRCC